MTISAIAVANSISRSTKNDKPINVNDQGKKLKFRDTLKGPHKDEWFHLEGVEIEQLLDSATMRPIHRSEILADRRKDITYHNPRPEEKYRDDGSVRRRIRTTIGGDRLTSYTGKRESTVAEKVVINIHQQSVISRRKLDKDRGILSDWRYATMDLESFYTSGHETSSRTEYMRIPVKRIPESVRIKYGLTDFIESGKIEYIIFEVTGTIYGGPAAGRDCQIAAESLLEKEGYIVADPMVPCLLYNEVTGISLTTVVDDYGIMYDVNKIDDLYALAACIDIKWKTKLDLSGDKYVGINIKWDNANNEYETDMPAYMPAAWARFCPNGPPPPRDTPAKPVYWQPGKDNQMATTDTSPLVSADLKLFIMQVVGVYLFYARMADPLMLPAVRSLAEQQSAPTEDTLAATYWLIAYSVGHGNAKTRYVASDTQLQIVSDGSFLPLKNIAGGYHFMGNHPDNPTCLTKNGPVNMISKVIPQVVTSAPECELASVCINAQEGMHERRVANALRWVQKTTPIKCDNNTAVGITTRSVKQKRSKSMDNRFNWITQKVDQRIYRVYWEKGKNNHADYQTKFLRHREVAEYITERHYNVRLLLSCARGGVNDICIEP